MIVCTDCLSLSTMNVDTNGKYSGLPFPWTSIPKIGGRRNPPSIWTDSYPIDPPTQRRARIVFQRQVQITDAGIAGLAEVAVGFNVKNVPKSSYEMAWQKKAEVLNGEKKHPYFYALFIFLPF